MFRVGIFGDSFADRTQLDGPFLDESWIKVLEDKGLRVVSYGKSGTSTWYSYEQFCSHYDQFDHIVFVYSQPDRIHYLPEGTEQYSYLHSVDDYFAAYHNSALNPLDEQTLLRIVSGHIAGLSQSFNFFVQQKIFDDINLRCREKNIRIVNVLPFENRKHPNHKLDFNSRYGDVFYNLLQVSTKELPHLLEKGFRDKRSCHLSKENNFVLAEIIEKSLSTDTRDIVDLFSHGNFIYDTEISKRYLAV
jgi:hypothetical protein